MRNLLLFVALLLGVFVGVGLFLPAEVHVERSIAIKRPAATVFTLLNGFRHFQHWSPWARHDPQAEYRRSGPEAGPGARLDWRGDPATVGTGWQEIVASEPFRRIEIALDIGAQGRARSVYEIHGDRVGSRLTWNFDTDVTEGVGWLGGLLGRWFGLFLDRWVGQDFERGLADFKTLAESLPPQDFSAADIEVLEVEPIEVLLAPGSSSQAPEAIAAALAGAYGSIMDHVRTHELEVVGQPLAITRAWEEGRYRFEAAIPVAGPVPELPGAAVRRGFTPSGRALRIVHRGPYETSGTSYELAAAYLAAHGLAHTGVTWEHYLSDPAETAAENIVTHIYFQLED